MDFLEWAARPVFLLARFLLWLIWELLCGSICWLIGWPVVRCLSLGRFPHAGWQDDESASFAESLVVCITGIGTLLLVLWYLSNRYGWSW